MLFPGDSIQRCDWATSEALITYHDGEWGVFSQDSRLHFEQICLSGLQAGLSWELILNRRHNLKRLFANFDFRVISGWSKKESTCICRDSSGIRNISKIEAVLNNARAFLRLENEHGNVYDYALELIGGKPKSSAYFYWHDIPSFSKESVALSCAFRKVGFKYFGPKIAYAYMQSVGLTDDHIVSCFRKKT